jgi:hypothetical protein
MSLYGDENELDVHSQLPPKRFRRFTTSNVLKISNKVNMYTYDGHIAKNGKKVCFERDRVYQLKIPISVF